MFFYSFYILAKDWHPYISSYWIKVVTKTGIDWTGRINYKELIGRKEDLGGRDKLLFLKSRSSLQLLLPIEWSSWILLKNKWILCQVSLLLQIREVMKFVSDEWHQWCLYETHDNRLRWFKDYRSSSEHKWNKWTHAELPH